MNGVGAQRAGFPTWACPDCGLRNDMLRAICRRCGGHRACEHYDGKRHCAEIPVRMYTHGPRCARHAPAVIRKAKEE